MSDKLLDYSCNDQELSDNDSNYIEESYVFNEGRGSGIFSLE